MADQPDTGTPPAHPNRSQRTDGTPLAGDTQPPRLPSGQQRTLVKGNKLGHQYLRVRVSPYAEVFRPRGQGVYEATERALQPHSRTGRAYALLKCVLLGRRIPTDREVHERLTKVQALAVLSSDAISSVAYATEASLGVLIAAGLGALQLNPRIALAIAALMIIVGTSYFQTIHAYPTGGGSYIVARDNLGDLPGLIAAAALLIDYVLTVSVSVSSGIDAFVSVVTPLAPYDVPLGVCCILLIVLINLRGMREASTIFAAPTYLFTVSFLIMIGAGVLYAATHGGGLLGADPPSNIQALHTWGNIHERLTLLLILTAFASGCSAMTGVEAISNGIPAFKPPEAKNAGRTLIAMIAILVTLFLGVTYLAWRFGIVPYSNQQPTVDAQIAALLFQKGYSAFRFMYYVVQFTTVLILVLAANTSFADFPRLSSILARDGFLPHLFALRGDRLAFTTGIVVLGAISAVLLVAFRGSTDALINLYALGVFTAFTLSQSGMVVHWYRLRDRTGRAWRRSIVINAVGALSTGIVTAIIAIAKFDRGAWIVIILVPLLVLMFRGIAMHYAHVQTETQPLTPLRADQLHHIAIVPIKELNRPALQALAYALSITPNVIAIHVSTSEEDERVLREKWARWIEGRRQARQPSVHPAPQLVVLESPYRSIVSPLVLYIDAIRDENPGATVTVILPEFVPTRWWERLLHNRTALRLKLALYTHPGVVVTDVPYHLKS